MNEEDRIICVLTHGQYQREIPQVLVVQAAVLAAPFVLLLLFAISDNFFLIESLWQSGQRTSSIADARMSSSSNGCPQSSQTNS
jgi:hypothetical protein